jgi:hypothetical protein
VTDDFGSDTTGLLVGPMPFHHESLPFAIAWTPKAGCTSLAKWFLFQTGDLAKALEYHNWIHRYRVEVFQRRHGYKTELAEIITRHSKPMFKLVRNPYDRAVSSFLAVLDAMEERRLKRGRHLPLVARGLLVEAGCGTTISFRQFLEALRSADLKHNKINPHIDLQYRDGEKAIVTRIIKLEDFEQEIRTLEGEFALAASPLELITRSRHHRQKQDGQAGSLAETQFAPVSIPHEETPSYDAFYDEHTVGLVRDVFDDDFAAYGYSK